MFSNLPTSQYTIWDPHVSHRHLRIHSILYDRELGGGYEALTYAEDLSSNGTFLNGTLMGRGKGAFLLSDGDTLRISPRFAFRFVADGDHEQPLELDDSRVKEIEVCQDIQRLIEDNKE